MRRLAGVLAAGLCLAAGGAEGQDAERGRALAEARQCGACHGAAGISPVPDAPSIAGQHTEFTTLQLVLFREGIRKVPAMQQAMSGLGDAEIEDLSAHFARLPHGPAPDRRPADAALVGQGQGLSAAMNCGACHRPDYSGRANVPRIAGQREEFIARTLREYRDNVRIGADTQMNGAMHGVTDAQIAALAHYLATR